jgi:hypothetical protein
MSHVSQLSRSSDSATHSRNTSRWIDLIAFLSVLGSRRGLAATQPEQQADRLATMTDESGAE